MSNVYDLDPSHPRPDSERFQIGQRVRRFIDGPVGSGPGTVVDRHGSHVVVVWDDSDERVGEYAEELMPHTPSRKDS